MGLKLVRFIALQSLAFRGEEAEPPRLRLRGLKRPLFPLVVECPPLHSTKISIIVLNTINRTI